MALPESIYKLEGWCDKKKSEKLYDLVLQNKSNLTLEIGVYGGRSFIPMALAHKKLNSGICIGIDPWCNNKSTENYQPGDTNYNWWKNVDINRIYSNVLDAINYYQIENHTLLIRDTSLNVVNNLNKESIDIIHQDGNHSESISCEEVLQFSDKLKYNGYWIMDDTDWETTFKAQKILLNLGYILYENHDGWKIFKKLDI